MSIKSIWSIGIITIWLTLGSKDISSAEINTNIEYTPIYTYPGVRLSSVCYEVGVEGELNWIANHRLTGEELEDILWLSRTAYSETKDYDEAWHIMWVIRNRVDTKYRNKTTYKGVVLDPYQFSAFNPTSNQRLLRLKNRYLNMGTNYPTERWRTYLKMSAIVRFANSEMNPLDSTDVRHFVHQKALTRIPAWLPDEPDVQVNELSIYQGI